MKSVSEIMGKIAQNFRRYVAVLVLSVLVLSVYGAAGRYEFINFDDRNYVTENPHVIRGLTLEGVAWAFSTFETGNWHPLTWMSHMADVSAFGLHAGRHHQVNVLFHLLNTILLFLVLKGMTGSLLPSAFAAALFAIHPLHVESVAWVSERKDVLSTFFWILGMGAYARYVRRPGMLRYLGVAACLALGLMAKPMLVTFPFALLLLDWWPLGRFGEGPLSARTAWPLVREKIPLIVLSVASSAVAYLAQSGGGMLATLENVPPGLRLSNAVLSYGWYLFKTAWPSGLAAFYPHPASVGESPAWWAAAGSALLLAGITFLTLRFGRRWPFIPVGWLWYLATLLPVIGLVQLGLQGTADRYTYVPLIGIFLVVSWGVPTAMSRWRWRFREPVLWVLGATVLVAASVSAQTQAGYWRDSVTLFNRALAVTEKNWLAWNNLGNAHKERGRNFEAMNCYFKALSIKRDYPLAWYNLGVSYGEMDRFSEAFECYRETLRLAPDFAPAWTNQGILHYGLGQPAKAVPCFQEALRLEPAAFPVWNLLGNSYYRLGMFPEAEACYRRAQALNPGNPAAR